MTSNFYDPDLPCSPASWLSMSEQERVRLVTNFHTAQRIRGKVRHHATQHVVVENYIAQGFGPATQALAALIQAGHARHEALHLIGREITESMEHTAEDPGRTQSVVSERLRRLTLQASKINES
jgi:predicted transcriptional regulator